MKPMKILTILLWLSTLLFSKAFVENNDTFYEEEAYVYPTHTCYRFNKEVFDTTLKISQDIVIEYSENIDELSHVSLKFPEPNDRRYGTDFECTKGESNIYQCTDAYHIGEMQVQFKDDHMSIHIDHAQSADLSESEIYRIKSKNKSFVQGVKTPCFVPVEPIIVVDGVKEGSPKEKLLQSIKMQNVIIYDLGYHNNLAIAVGEDNSPKMREMQRYEENHESVILRTTNGGKSWQKLEFKRDIPHEKVMVLDDKHIVIASSWEGAGGFIDVSSDGGDSWHTTNDKGMIQSLELVGKELVLTNIVDEVWKSKDHGNSWQMQKEVELKKEVEIEKEDEVVTKDENTTVKESKQESIAVLEIPQYRVDYETNTLIVQHFKKACDCDQFSLPLIYNQSNQRKGILGPYWSLGIESHITVLSKDKLSLFDALTGKEKIYIKDNTTKDTFRHGARKIIQTKNGYFTAPCKTKDYFNKEGNLVKVAYKDKSYAIHYQDKKISKVMEVIDGKSHPYLSFTYHYEGPKVTYEYMNEPKNITFLKGKEGILSNILDGTHNIFHYEYTYGEDKTLAKLEYMPGTESHRTIFVFDNASDEEMTVFDYRGLENGVIEEKIYASYSKGTEHTCVVSSMRKYINVDSGTLYNVQHSIDMYHFSYADATRQKLLSTEHGPDRYGFDEMGRVNYHARWGKEISVDYHPFGKMAYSTVKEGDKVSQYTYHYMKDEPYNLIKIDSPNGPMELKYSEKGLISELEIDQYHLYYEYNESGRPIKIKIKGKGEVAITYDDKDEISSVKTVLVDKSLDEHKVALDVTRAMTYLMQRVSEGSIKNYPRWVW